MVDTLTPRQAAVLTLVARGHTDAEIAALLGVRRQTVSEYLTTAYTRLGVTSRTGAAVALVTDAWQRASTTGGCLVFPDRASALAALASREER
ncbi:MAG: helix-turn-helix domain-containing protein [Thermomicrobiales bacterium]